MAEYQESSASTEHVGSRRVVDEYLVPLLRELAIKPGASGLSDGCGIGADVEALRDHGFDAWGGDPGARSVLWAQRRCAPYLMHFNGTALPFAGGSFDFVFSEGVVEHVGIDRDVKPDLSDRAHIQRERRLYCTEMYRVLRPGGYAIVAAPNRLFPIDFFHGGRPFLGLAARFHGPNEAFLAAADDLPCWLAGKHYRMRAATLRRFFNTGLVGRRGLLGRTIEIAWDLAVSLVPDELMARIGPYFVVLIHKRTGS